ncbi:hypothetical protein DXG01_012848 [Tephrocybe rancida]|nr:hypothetical protein DXG01_012848 [Tephrocybe rancida]
MTSGVRWIQELLGPYEDELKLILPSVASLVVVGVMVYVYLSYGNRGPATANIPQEAILTTGGPSDNQDGTSGNTAPNDAPAPGPTTTTESTPTRSIPALRELDIVGTALSDHAEELIYVRSMCSDLEERNAYLEDEARDGVVVGEEPPPSSLEEGAFDDWSAAVVSGAADFAPPDAPHAGEPPAEYPLFGLLRTYSYSSSSLEDG